MLLGVLITLTISVSGCGTTKEQLATQQLLLSDAVDRSVSTIDFRPLSGAKVFLDTAYLKAAKTESIVNSDYVTSSLRQQIMAAGCLLQETDKEADIIIEARIGTLGSDDHRVTFGIPENNALGSASVFVPGAPQVPQIPEIAVARRDARESAAKIAAFAYNRETREAIWQSGISQSRSTARDTWVLGVGPFQAGSIRGGTRIMGNRLSENARKRAGSPPKAFERPPVDYTAVTRFDSGWPVLSTVGGHSQATMPGTGLVPGDELPPEISSELVSELEVITR